MHKNAKHHAFPQVNVGSPNKYGITAFHVHLTRNDINRDVPPIRAIPETVIAHPSNNFLAMLFIICLSPFKNW